MRYGALHLVAAPVHGRVRILVHFIIESDKLYFTCVRKKKMPGPGPVESFRSRRFATKENNAILSAPATKRPVAPNWAPGSAGLETDGDRLGWSV